jgi:hypothetical protein
MSDPVEAEPVFSEANAGFYIHGGVDKGKAR